MIKEDTIRRLKRFLEGDRRIEDLDRIFLYLRDKAYGRESIRELGDFVAHRDQREKGPVTQRIQDFFEASDVYFKSMLGELPDLSKLRKSASANLRMAPDELILERLGVNKRVAQKRLEEGIRNIETGRSLTTIHTQTIDYLGASLIWRPAFTANELNKDLNKMIIRNKLVHNANFTINDDSGIFLTLYAITIMHGSSIKLSDGRNVPLRAEIDTANRLVVRSSIPYLGTKKPMTALFCIFFSELHPEKTCATELQKFSGPWESNIELGPDGLLHLVT